MQVGDSVGAYEIREHIADGGMARVFKVWHSGLHRYEALKVPLPHLGFDPDFGKRFLDEARMAANLQHPYIIGIHSVSDTAAGRYFTMEYVDGFDLASLLEQRKHLPLADALPILSGIADALDYAHGRGVIHRDMKPSNILLLPDGKGGQSPKVADFGIARAQKGSGGTRVTKTGMIIGTPEYMSPEQAGSGAPTGPRSDQYSLAVIAYEMLCGRPPFQSENPMTVIVSHLKEPAPPASRYYPGLPAAVSKALAKALSKSPEERFSSCRAFVDALSGAAVPVAGSAPAATATAGGAKRGAVVVAALLLAGIALVTLAQRNKSGDAPPSSSIEREPAPGVPARTADSSQEASLPEDNTTREKPAAPLAQEAPQPEETDTPKRPIASVGASNTPASETEPEPPVQELTEDNVDNLMHRWLAAQNERAYAAYARLYAADFTGVKRTRKGGILRYGRTGWLADRRKMIETTRGLAVEVENKRVTIKDGLATISFDQYFRSRTYSDWGPKVIQARMTPEGVQIVHEEMLESFPL